jgi:Fis family transcriptional regulator
MSKNASNGLAQAVETALEYYFENLNGETPTGLHKMVIFEVEKSLFESVMKLAEGNQSQAAKMLGINRNTLRTRLGKFDML